MSTLPTTFSGGCACGAIRYESAAAPVFMLNCHCRDCQRSSGGSCSSFVIVPADAFRLTQGTLRYHATSSERGGRNHRGFCADCGSPVVAKPELSPEITALWPGSLDDPGWFRPQVNAWTSDAISPDHLDPAIPAFHKYPG